MNILAFARRSLGRELRHGDLATLAAALVLAVAALAAVSTLALRIEQALLGHAATLLGGDLGVSSRNALPDPWTELAAEHRLSSTRIVSFPSMLFTGERSQLAEIRAVAPSYPLRGELRVRRADGSEASAAAPPPGSAYAARRLLDALGLEPGGNLDLAGRSLTIAGELISEPDGGEWFQLAPRLVVALSDAEAAGLLGYGSRANHRFLVAGASDALAEFRGVISTQLPSNTRWLTVEDMQRNLRTVLNRGGRVLRLAALLAALLAGVAVALAAHRYASRKRDEFALLLCLGAKPTPVLAALATTVLLLALPACALGALLGLLIQEAILQWAAAALPGTLEPLPWQPALVSAAYGLLLLLGFALPPLLRLRRVPPMRVFQRGYALATRRYRSVYLLPLGASFALVLAGTQDLRLTLFSLGGLLVVAVVAGLLIRAVIAALRHGPSLTRSTLRFGLANVARRAQTSVVQGIALSMSLCALFLLAYVAPSLLDAWRRNLPADTPNTFALNINATQRESLLQRLDALDARRVNALPLAIAKLAAINGKAVRAEDLKDPRAARWADGPLNISWSAILPEANRIVRGQFPEASSSAAELSVDTMWAEMFDLKLGDQVTLSVGEREVIATLTSVRAVDWDSFRVNFFLLLNEAGGKDLPHSLVASFYLPQTQRGQLASLSRDFPGLSFIDIGSVLDRVRSIASQVSEAVQSVLSFSLIAGLLVVLAAVQATRDERRLEAALLRTLGARRRQLDTAVLAEFSLLGLISAGVAALGAAGTGVLLAREAFEIDYSPPWLALGLSALAATVLVAGAGYLGTRAIARASPLIVLRQA